MGELINGRTPEEIKRWVDGRATCNTCPKEHEVGCEDGERTEDCQMTIDTIAYIERLESERDAALAKVPKWIGVEDKLPEKECKVLVYIGACNITQGWYLGDGVFEVGIGAKFNVKSAFDRIVLPCWMPMPEPPKEGTT